MVTVVVAQYPDAGDVVHRLLHDASIHVDSSTHRLDAALERDMVLQVLELRVVGVHLAYQNPKDGVADAGKSGIVSALV